MLWHTLITVGAPLLARFTLTRAAKKGLLPAKHYLRQTLDKLNTGDLESALGELQMLHRRKSQSLDVQAATDLLRMKVDSKMKALQQEEAELKESIDGIHEILQGASARSRRIILQIKIWLPAVLTVWAASSFLAVAVELVAPFSGVPEGWIHAGVVFGLVVFAWIEARHILNRQRIANIYRRFQAPTSGFLRRRLANLIQERDKVQAEIKRLQRLQTALRELEHQQPRAQKRFGIVDHVRNRLSHAIQSYR